MCNNKASYFVPRGFATEEIITKCGSTATIRGHVTTVFCEKCQDDPQVQAEHEARLAASEADNDWMHSAGWGDI